MTLYVVLRPIDEEDLLTLFKWRNDPLIMSRTRQWRELSWKEHKSWFDNLDLDKNLMYGIVSSRSDINEHAELVGVCGLCYIDLINRSAEVSIYIGDSFRRRTGIGSEVLRYLKIKAFDVLGLHRIYAEIYAFNVPGIRLFEGCSFKCEATISDTVYMEGGWFSSKFYTYKEDDWR
ncbi:MAG: GNAT family N-acetyltransferase [Planctomycetes bacterium]|nr:GNAT family N-acetyltransferase [Planctomycetota bacterium]